MASVGPVASVANCLVDEDEPPTSECDGRAPTCAKVAEPPQTGFLLFETPPALTALGDSSVDAVSTPEAARARPTGE